MDDLISRAAAIDVIEAGRLTKLIDAETAVNGLQALPIVDATPVVRCRDCEHKDCESGFCRGRGWPMQLVPDDGFCDKGERKGGPDEH